MITVPGKKRPSPWALLGLLPELVAGRAERGRGDAAIVAASLEIRVATSSDGTAVPQVEQNRLSSAICEPHDWHLDIVLDPTGELTAVYASRRERKTGHHARKQKKP
jgi:hypothetical protein